MSQQEIDPKIQQNILFLQQKSNRELFAQALKYNIKGSHNNNVLPTNWTNEQRDFYIEKLAQVL